MARRALWAIIAAFAGCIGCAGDGPGEPFRPAMIGPDQGVLYIYREAEGVLGGSGPVRVTMDDASIAELRAGRYIAIEAPPGEHFVRIEHEGEAVARCRISAGDSVYLRVTVGSFGRLVVETVDSAAGQREISRTRIGTP